MMSFFVDRRGSIAAAMASVVQVGQIEKTTMRKAEQFAVDAHVFEKTEIAA